MYHLPVPAIQRGDDASSFDERDEDLVEGEEGVLLRRLIQRLIPVVDLLPFHLVPLLLVPAVHLDELSIELQNRIHFIFLNGPAYEEHRRIRFLAYSGLLEIRSYSVLHFYYWSRSSANAYKKNLWIDRTNPAPTLT